MFKRRLMVFAYFLVFGGFLVVVALASNLLAIQLATMNETVTLTVLGTIGAALILRVLYLLIFWLFIEPYRDWKSNK